MHTNDAVGILLALPPQPPAAGDDIRGLQFLVVPHKRQLANVVWTVVPREGAAGEEPHLSVPVLRRLAGRLRSHRHVRKPRMLEKARACPRVHRALCAARSRAGRDGERAVDVNLQTTTDQVFRIRARNVSEVT